MGFTAKGTDPDKLYYTLVKAVKDSPKLVIINGNEGKCHLELAMLEGEKYYYFELDITYDGRQSNIVFANSKIKQSDELAKAIENGLPNILDELFRNVSSQLGS